MKDWIEDERRGWEQLVLLGFCTGVFCGAVLGMMFFAIATAP